MNQRVIYVTPLRALSAQAERDLADTFIPLGFSVSSLYGAAGIESADQETLRGGDIVISTPEKLDFALRNDGTLIADVGLIVLDEGPYARYGGEGGSLRSSGSEASEKVGCPHSAHCLPIRTLPTPEEMRDLVAWLRRDKPGDPVHSTWQPTRRRFGVIRWMGTYARLNLEVESERPFVPRFVEAVPPPSGSRRRKTFRKTRTS